MSTMIDLPCPTTIGDALEAHDWRFAKTMPNNPHSYTLREHWRSDDFDAVVKFIRMYGVPTMFAGHEYIEWRYGNYSYWTMGAPIPETILINRKCVDAVPITYDKMAAEYDTFFDNPTMKDDEKTLFRYLGDMTEKSVLDIGCGTGLLLEYSRPKEYVGIDPSLGMLTVLTNKFAPDVFDTHCLTFDGFLKQNDRRFDLGVALYGVGSYLTAEELDRIPEVCDEWFVMGYQDNYRPFTYKKAGVELGFYSRTSPTVWGNYWVWSNRS